MLQVISDNCLEQTCQLLPCDLTCRTLLQRLQAQWASGSCQHRCCTCSSQAHASALAASSRVPAKAPHCCCVLLAPHTNEAQVLLSLMQLETHQALLSGVSIACSVPTAPGLQRSGWGCQGESACGQLYNAWLLLAQQTKQQLRMSCAAHTHTA